MTGTSEYFLTAGVATDRSGDAVREQRPTVPQEASMSTLAQILYIASVLRARPRVIDGYIDYFGELAASRPEELMRGFGRARGRGDEGGRT